MSGARQVFSAPAHLDQSTGRCVVELSTSNIELRAILRTAARQAERDGMRHTAERLWNDVALVEEVSFERGMTITIEVKP